VGVVVDGSGVLVTVITRVCSVAQPANSRLTRTAIRISLVRLKRHEWTCLTIDFASQCN
jgi:hypothetical protein